MDENAVQTTLVEGVTKERNGELIYNILQLLGDISVAVIVNCSG